MNLFNAIVTIGLAGLACLAALPAKACENHKRMAMDLGNEAKHLGSKFTASVESGNRQELCLYGRQYALMLDKYANAGRAYAQCSGSYYPIAELDRQNAEMKVMLGQLC